MKRYTFKEYYALVVIMGGFLVLIIEVIFRHAFGSSLEWSDEIARLLLIWMTFTGMGLAILERREIFVRTFRGRFTPRGRRRWQASLEVLALAFNVFLLIFGIEMTGFSRGMKTESLELPFSFLYLSIPAGAILCIVYLVKRLRNPGPEPTGEG
ncbi:MAG TPA: TRAP transporter small permease [Thermodesulfobacteriota bacterium]|nr:TRAP transporter small permease [Thermodesulfobacteriota bacterium]